MKLSKKYSQDAQEIRSLQQKLTLSTITFDELIRLMIFQPQNVSYWKFLYDNYGTSNCDKILLSHTKNYVAWAFKKKYNINPETDIVLLQAIFKDDPKNFHAHNYINHLRENIVSFDFPLLQKVPDSLEVLEKKLTFDINNLQLWDQYLQIGSLEFCREICYDGLEINDFGPQVAFAKLVLQKQLFNFKAEAIRLLEQIQQPHIIFLATFLKNQLLK
ncbi:hypothetical protein SS50377_22472 [Spironucleus salmonicida]|uniref:Uncharacterized protein n=1 Tax=Spironucleus salmonicida TaxID=348837 RepID=V6LC41_9EUKA|nr:hypothetical protein SS50377_22472 [Spironucleus salmonicida]|eukprot:EST42037.1 Hypothetical protein SS50377_18344 [Spironucleus salmonicida]